MSETLTLPVLPVDDEVVLPGMVVPLETSQPEVGAAIDAARMPSRQVPGMRSETKARVLLVPRLADRGLAGVGTLAVVEQVGRLPGGQPGAVVRGTARVKIGSGTTGPGAALWVEGTVIEESVLFCAITLVTSQCLAESPLARPSPPQVQIRGTTGLRTIYYWQFAKDPHGHSRYSDPLIVTNAPDVLSEQNAVVITPVAVAGATEYGILTSRIEAPRDLKIEVGVRGDKTFYYWSQTRNGRTVWSRVEGPVKVEGCAAQPENKITWTATGAEFYYLYRTETPTKPIGWRNCGILTALRADLPMAWSDKGISTLESRLINPSDHPSQKPEGQGRYLLGVSKGDAVLDRGQELKWVEVYDMNTTDTAYRRFMPEVKGYEPSGDRGAFQFDSENRVVSPTYSWDNLTAIAVHQNNHAGGLNAQAAPGVSGVSYESAKNTYNGFDIHQMNYTAGQHSPYFSALYSYSVGDNILLHSGIQQWGQNRDGGDEGSEFFSIHMSRNLMVNHVKIAADANLGSIYLKIDGDRGLIAQGRGIVNLSQAYHEGSARVEAREKANGEATPTAWKPNGAIVKGTGTHWTPDMEGWFFSFDADTTEHDGKPVRQWYRVRQYVSPTELKLFAYTYFNVTEYKGSAYNDGPYLICPYTEMTDGDSASFNEGLRVAPLTCHWKKGDELEIIAGPHTTFRLGWWELGGEFLPQDQVAGLGIAYTGKKSTDEGALAIYGNDKGRWESAVQCFKVGVGLKLYEADVGMEVLKDTPVVFRVNNETNRYQLSQGKDGLVLEDVEKKRWLGFGPQGLSFYGRSTIHGSERTRGLTTFSGDGKTAQFRIKFPDAYETRPFVVASSNLPIGLGVTETSKEGCTVSFAQPPPAGNDNVEVTWMVQE